MIDRIEGISYTGDMLKIVISGSAKLQDKIDYWKTFFLTENYEVLDYPKSIDEEKFMELYPDVYKNFFINITKADTLFVMNEDKNSIEGYIGAAAYAELTFGLAQNLLYHKNINLVILKMPSREVQCYDEIKLWLELGWVKLYERKEEPHKVR